MKSSVKFYSTIERYGCFSNFYPAPISIDDVLWPTSEHFFQAMKFDDKNYQEKIRAQKKPMHAAKLGRCRDVPLRVDWEKVKEEYMRRALMAKFSQHNDLRNILLGTGELELIEHTNNDSYWGDGGDGTGKNRLEKLLMEIRNHFSIEG